LLISSLSTDVLIVIHIGAASLWIGNSFFIDFVLNPGLTSLGSSQSRNLALRTSNRAIIVAWFSMITASATGIVIAELLGQLNIEYLVSFRGLFLLTSILLTSSAIINGSAISLYFIPQTRTANIKIAAQKAKTLNRLIKLNTVLALATTVAMVILRGP
jgi:uncharacterized membrane protein